MIRRQDPIGMQKLVNLLTEHFLESPQTCTEIFLLQEDADS